jgi:hypothetical protein
VRAGAKRAELGMCEKCKQLDEKIERYRRFSKAVTDALTLERIEKLIAELGAEKAGLHPDEQGRP